VDLSLIRRARLNRDVPWAELDRDPLNAANDDHARVMTVLVEVSVEDVAHANDLICR
jgi:hypothetical protein